MNYIYLMNKCYSSKVSPNRFSLYFYSFSKQKSFHFFFLFFHMNFILKKKTLNFLLLHLQHLKNCIQSNFNYYIIITRILVCVCAFFSITTTKKVAKKDFFCAMCVAVEARSNKKKKKIK